MPRREVSTTEIVRDALRQGKVVFIPYIYSKDNEKQKLMDMLRLKDEEDLAKLEPDSWGIPSLSDKTVASRENAMGGCGISNSNSIGQAQAHLDLIFVPGMAFDSSNNRLGHGKGFYDRYLSRIKASIETAGSQQEFPRLSKLVSKAQPDNPTNQILVGLSLREQLLASDEHVPVTQEDWKIDCLITADKD